MAGITYTSPTDPTSITNIPQPIASHHRHHPPGSHLATLLDESISKLAPFSALILTLCVIVVFVLRLYFFEGFLVKTRLYRARYEILSEEQRRSLVNHHLAALLKLVLLFTAVYPFLSIAFGTASPHTPFVHGSRVTMGDVMIICSNIFTVMYIFELFYRVNVSPISALHHIGAIVIAQTAVAISLDFVQEVDAVFEFIICFVWGAFDVSAELWPHIAIIMYRLLPLSNNTSTSELSTSKAAHNHLKMSKVFFFTSILEFTGTTVETIVVFWLFGMVWKKWTLVFKIMTPVLHVLFSCAQLWSAWVFRQLSIKEGERGRTLMHQAQEEIRLDDTLHCDQMSEKDDEDEYERSEQQDEESDDIVLRSSDSIHSAEYEKSHGKAVNVGVEDVTHAI